MKASIAVLFILALFLAGCKTAGNGDDVAMVNAKDITLRTEDNIVIKATHYQGKGDGVILLHMLPADRNEWKQFAVRLQKLGYNVIAIDYRWQVKQDAVHKDAIKDVKAARNYLNSSRIIIVGSSIGANLALNYALQDQSVAVIILLSPGENYRGVETFNAMRSYNKNVLIIASEDDSQSINASKKLYQLASGDKEIKIYQRAGHGTNMFSQPDLADFIINWLDKYK